MLSRDMLMGIGLGAALAFVVDPRGGRRRRALVRDQFVRAGRKTRDALETTARDLANRTAGVAAATRGRLRREQIDDPRLVERVRAKLGRASSHPQAIDVEALNGVVTLRGPVLADELDDVLYMIGRVSGVRDVVNQLQGHRSAEGIPALQGQGNVADASLDILQRRWAPATRALVAAAGLTTTAVCVAAWSRRSLTSNTPDLQFPVPEQGSTRKPERPTV